MSSFANAAPEILNSVSNNQTFRESEHYRTLQVQDYLFTVIYDLLIADNQQAQILDWKTYPKPLNKRKLEQNWQTRLYLYVLAETSDYLPENISMTYWFVQSEGKPQSVKFSYSNIQHQKTVKKLNQILTRLTYWIERYYHKEPFPQEPEGSKACDYCQYTKRCNRQSRTEDIHSLATSEQMLEAKSPTIVDTNLLNIASIQEVTL
jgi:hypothetical protein